MKVLRLGRLNYGLSGDPPENPRLLRSELVAEPLWYLRSIPYKSYTGTDHWKIRRQQFMDAFLAEHGELRCERCDLAEIDRVEVEVRWWSNYNGNPCSADTRSASMSAARSSRRSARPDSRCIISPRSGSARRPTSATAG